MMFVVCVCVAECGCLLWGYDFYPTLLHWWQNPNVAGQNKKEDLSVNVPSETRTRCHILYTRYFKAWFCLKPGIRLLCSAVCSSTLVLIESWIICFIRSRLQSLCDVNFLLYTSKFAFVRLCKRKLLQDVVTIFLDRYHNVLSFSDLNSGVEEFCEGLQCLQVAGRCCTFKLYSM